LLSFVLGLGLGMSQPMTLVLLHRLLPPARIGEAVGLRMSLIYATQTTLPVGFGAIGASVGLVPVFWSMSAAIVAGAGLIGRGLARAGLLQARTADASMRSVDEANDR
jgi:MFS family permease